MSDESRAPAPPPAALLDELRRQRDRLARSLAEAQAQISNLDALLEAAEANQAGDPLEASEWSPPRAPKPPRSTVRAKALDALEDLGFVTFTRQLGPYVEARYGGKLPAARFGVLARDEERAYRSSRPRPVYLCFGLTQNGEPIKRLLARSDWPLEERIVGPTTGRVQNLKMTARLCELAEQFEDSAFDIDRLRFLAADHARDLPGVRVKHGQFPLRDWRDKARHELERFEERDGRERADAAQRLAGRPEHARLFGVEVIDGEAERPHGALGAR